MDTQGGKGREGIYSTTVVMTVGMIVVVMLNTWPGLCNGNSFYVSTRLSPRISLLTGPYRTYAFIHPKRLTPVPRLVSIADKHAASGLRQLTVFRVR